MYVVIVMDGMHDNSVSDFSKELDMCLRNTDAPAATKLKFGKISKSHILTQPHSQGHVMTGEWAQPLDELIVQVCYCMTTKL